MLVRIEAVDEGNTSYCFALCPECERQVALMLVEKIENRDANKPEPTMPPILQIRCHECGNLAPSHNMEFGLVTGKFYCRECWEKKGKEQK